MVPAISLRYSPVPRAPPSRGVTPRGARSVDARTRRIESHQQTTNVRAAVALKRLRRSTRGYLTVAPAAFVGCPPMFLEPARVRYAFSNATAAPDPRSHRLTGRATQCARYSPP